MRQTSAFMFHSLIWMLVPLFLPVEFKPFIFVYDSGCDIFAVVLACEYRKCRKAQHSLALLMFVKYQFQLKNYLEFVFQIMLEWSWIPRVRWKDLLSLDLWGRSVLTSGPGSPATRMPSFNSFFEVERLLICCQWGLQLSCLGNSGTLRCSILFGISVS